MTAFITHATGSSHDNRASTFAQPAVRTSLDADGGLLIRHGLDLEPYDHQVGDWIRRGALQFPQRVALGEWDAQGQLQTLDYAQLMDRCDRVAQFLLDSGLSQERPIAILSEKSLSNAVLTLAAMQSGIPVCPISPAYSLRSEARGRLMACIRKLSPGLVLVDDGIAFAEAIALLPAHVRLVYETKPPPNRPDALPFSDLLLAVAGPEVDAAFELVDIDAPAKILFTSGSTGEPKAAINTHRMMCSNTCAQTQLFPFLRAHPPVVVDWQPWHHCGGSSHNFHTVIGNGGSYYIDHGKPTTEDAFMPTLHALRQVSPTLHFNVPLGYDRLALHMGRDTALRKKFFARLDCLVYSGAAMPTSLWDELERLCQSERGVRVPMVSSYGMTEMAPLHTSLHWHEGRPGMIGLPIPGSIVKLVPVDDKLELRAKGPNITPGYFRSPALTAEAFDAQGWYKSGDAVRLVDPRKPELGLQLEGRLTDQFKLQSGTWVRVGDLRTEIVSACAPLLADVLIAGEGRKELGVLAVPHLAACRDFFALPDATLNELLALQPLRDALRHRLAAFNAANPASSRRIARVLMIGDVPSLAAGETTDKGHVNQKLALQRRGALVERLFDDTDAQVIKP
jgi:feruloyl-CoA synthase